MVLDFIYYYTVLAYLYCKWIFLFWNNLYSKKKYFFFKHSNFDLFKYPNFLLVVTVLKVRIRSINYTSNKLRET